MSVQGDGRFDVDMRVLRSASVIEMIILTTENFTFIALPAKESPATHFVAEVIKAGKVTAKGLKLTVILLQGGFSVSYTDKLGPTIITGSLVEGTGYLASLDRLNEVDEK